MLTAVVLWIIAIIFILLTSLNMIRRKVKTKHCTATASAQITDVKEKIKSRNGFISREYHPTISYTIDGTTYSRKYTTAYTGDTYHLGQIIDILYNPQKPEEVNTIGTSNKTDVVLLVIGVVIGVAGVVILAVQK